MSIAAGPDGADEGLTFSVDFANPRSYAGSGTTVNSIVNASNTGTINNGASFSTLNGGYLTLDGTDDYIIFNNPDTLKTSSMSISAWINLTNNSGYGDGAIIAGFTDGTNWRYGMSLYIYGGNIYSYCGNGTNTYSATSTIGMGNWTHVCGTYDASTLILRLYINGILVATTTSAYLTHNATNNLVIGHGIGYTSYLATRIGSVQIFNKALSATEILQNFIATKPRYNPPNYVSQGLVLYLDAGSTSSYSGSGTTWTDISGAGNNGTLTNGPTFSALNGGYFTFDRVDDYCIVPFTTILNDCTISIWFKATSTASYQYPFSLGNGSNTSYAFHLDMNDPDLGITGQTMWVYWNSGGTPYSVLSRSGTYGDYNDSTWRNYCFVRNNSDASVTRHYMNGAERTTGVTRVGTQTTQFGNGAGYSINIARFHAGGNFFAGNIAIVQVYNRALTNNEILTNFNAYRTRYGV